MIPLLLLLKLASLLIIMAFCVALPYPASALVPLVLGNAADLDPSADLALFLPSSPQVQDANANPVLTAKAGGQYTVAMNVTNNDLDKDWASVVIVEVRDSKGITQMLNWQSQVVAANSTIKIGMSWVPERAGNYEIRAFVLSGLNNPHVLSAVVTNDVEVS